MRCKSSLTGLLRVCVMTVGALTLALTAATAYADLDVTLICPPTFTVGTMLNLGLTLEKEQDEPFSTTITKTAVAIHTGNLSISGPFAVPVSVTLADNTPDLTPCGGLGQPECTYSATATIPNYLSMPLRRVSRGTFISVGVAVLNSANKPISEGWCNIETQ